MPETPLFGYKMHLAVDHGSGLVRQAILTPANVSDHTPATRLIQGDEQALFADKDYDGWWLRHHLVERSIVGRRQPDAAGTAAHDAVLDAALGTIRAPVERTFAVMKRWYGYARVRYRSLARNALQLQLLCVAVNLRCALVLTC